MALEFQQGIGQGTLIYFPGWATDAQLFLETVKPGMSVAYFPSMILSPDAWKGVDFSAYSAPRTLLGFSMGGFWAAQVAAAFPTLFSKVILVGVRQRYLPGVLQPMYEWLERDSEACTQQFYRGCFSSRRDYETFERGHQNRLLKRYTQHDLIEGLDVLGQLELRSEDVRKIDGLKLIHGKLDRIAPLAEVQALVDSLATSPLTCLDSGHCGFYLPEFRQILLDLAKGGNDE